MKTIRVAEATDIQLNWLVATAEGLDPQLNRDSHGGVWFGWTVNYPTRFRHLPKFCTDPAAMQPIIERDYISTSPGNWTVEDDDKTILVHNWASWSLRSEVSGDDPFCYGDTALVAAARCLVISKLGDIVEVPEELS